MKKTFVTLLLMISMLGITLFSFTGCSKKENNEDVVSNEKEIKVAGGTLRLAVSKYDTLNPLLNKNKDVDQILQLIFNPLMEIGNDLKPKNVLASSVVVDSVGASIDVKLRDDVKFHDGTSLTADDVIYSLDTLKKAEDTVVYKNVLGNIGTYKKLDDLTVRFYLRQVYSNPEYALCFPIVSKAYYTNKNNDTINNAIGTGMFKITNVSLMQEINLEKNKEYFDKIPYIDNIKVMLVPNEKTIHTAFKQKQIDVMFTKDMIAGQYTGNDTVKMIKYDTMNYDFLGFNFNNAQLADARIRRIIAHTINKKAIVKDVYYNYAKVADTMIHPSSFLFSSSLSSYEYDIKMAKNILNKSDIDASKLNFRLLVNKENVERVNIANIIKQNLSEVGIILELNVLPYEEYVQKIESKDFDLILGGWHLLTNQDISFAYSSSKIYGGQNYISYNNPQMDEALLKAYTQIGEINVKTAFADLQDFLSNELPYISIAFRENVGYINKTKVGGTLNPLESKYYNGIEELYIRKNAQKQ